MLCNFFLSRGLGHMVDAMQLSSFLAIAHMVDAMQLSSFLAIAHMVDAMQLFSIPWTWTHGRCYAT